MKITTWMMLAVLTLPVKAGDLPALVTDGNNYRIVGTNNLIGPTEYTNFADADAELQKQMALIVPGDWTNHWRKFELPRLEVQTNAMDEATNNPYYKKSRAHDAGNGPRHSPPRFAIPPIQPPMPGKAMASVAPAAGTTFTVPLNATMLQHTHSTNEQGAFDIWSSFTPR
jgi:hypothetical protein